MPEIPACPAPIPGPEAEFAAWYDSQRMALHAYLLGKTGDAVTALDLFQETFLRAWQHFALLQTFPPDRRRYWLFAVARNVTTDHHRRRAGEAGAVQTLGDRAARRPAEQPAPQKLLERREQVLSLTAAINDLPDDWRTALVLQTLGGQSSAEIAALLGVPAGTVRYWIVRARKELAATLKLTPAGSTKGTTHAH